MMQFCSLKLLTFLISRKKWGIFWTRKIKRENVSVLHSSVVENFEKSMVWKYCGDFAKIWRKIFSSNLIAFNFKKISSNCSLSRWRRPPATSLLYPRVWVCSDPLDPLHGKWTKWTKNALTFYVKALFFSYLMGFLCIFSQISKSKSGEMEKIQNSGQSWLV